MPDSLPEAAQSARFPKSARLLNSADFSKVFAKARACRHAHFTLLVRSRSQQAGPRLGFVIAKKKVRHSVSRNRIKRVVRESFRQHMHALPAIDIIFLAKPGLGDLSNEQIRKGLAKHWNKLTSSAFT